MQLPYLRPSPPWARSFGMICNRLLAGLIALYASCSPQLSLLIHIDAHLADKIHTRQHPLILVWQMPSVSISLYFIFLIGRDSPAVSLKSSFISVTVVVLAVAVELAVIISTDNDPMARLLSVTVVTFIAGMLVVSTNFNVRLNLGIDLLHSNRVLGEPCSGGYARQKLALAD